MYQYIRPYIGADDFIEPLYHSVAIMLFEQLDKEEKINPAAILSRFTDAEEQKEIAAIFNTQDVYKRQALERGLNVSMEANIQPTVIESQI